MALDGGWLGELTRLIASAYDLGELERFVRVRLGVELFHLVARKVNDEETAYELIVKLNARGRTRELVEALRDDRPGRADIRQFCETYLAQPAAPSGPPPEVRRSEPPGGPEPRVGVPVDRLTADRRRRELLELLTDLRRAAVDLRPDRAGVRVVSAVIGWVVLTMLCGGFGAAVLIIGSDTFGAAKPGDIHPAWVGGVYLVAGVTAGWLLVRAARAHRPGAEERARRALERLRQEFPDEFARWGEANLRDEKCLDAIIRDLKSAGPA